MAPISMIPVAILAGGLGTRLRSVTGIKPKAMVEVAGEPFVAHQLRLLKRESISRVVLCVGYLGEMIRDFVGDGSQFGMEVSYSFDGEKLLGTGGALRRALPQLGDAFFVLYGDSYLDIHYTPVLEAYRDVGAEALMTIFRNEGCWDTSNVLFDGQWVTRYEKRTPMPEMRYIDYGLGILSREVLSQQAQDEAFDLGDLYSRLANEGRLAGLEISQRFYEVGTPTGLAETEAYITTR